MRSPVFQFFHLPQRVFMSVNSGDARTAQQHTVTLDESIVSSTRLLRPMRAHLGLARVDEHSKYAVEADLSAPHRDGVTGETTRAVVNGRAGPRWRVSLPLAVGAGFHTDFSNAAAGSLTAIDYYRMSLGAELGSAFTARSEDDPTQPDRRTIATTTLALSYAIGVGHLANETLTTNPDGTLGARPVDAKIVAHELMVYLDRRWRSDSAAGWDGPRAAARRGQGSHLRNPLIFEPEPEPEPEPDSCATNPRFVPTGGHGRVRT